MNPIEHRDVPIEHEDVPIEHEDVPVLVAYASRCGSTGEVAQEIGQALRETGAAVDVRPVQEVEDLRPYRAVIVGSAIWAGHLLPEAASFLETHQQVLRTVPTSCFAVCMTLSEDTVENRRTVDGYMTSVREMVQPVSEGLFAGVMDYKRLSWIHRAVVKMFKVPEGDYRNWEAVRTWARHQGQALLGS